MSTLAPWTSNKNNLAMNNSNIPSLSYQKGASHNACSNNSGIDGIAPIQPNAATTPIKQQSIYKDFVDVQAEFASISGIENTL